MKHSSRFLALVDDAKSRVQETTVDLVREELDGGSAFTLVDTREESEWNAARARGAIHLGKGVIERDIERVMPDMDAKMVLYCAGGYRSALAADALQRMGYRNVLSLAGGWRAWRGAGMPVDETPPAGPG